jgi:transposase
LKGLTRQFGARRSVIRFPDRLIRGAKMGKAIALRQDYCAAELRRFAREAKDANLARRLLALAGICEGMTRAAAARIGGMDRQTLRDWVHRFNLEGVEGLRNVKPCGRPSKLSASHLQELRALVEAGPDPAKDEVVRWRCVDLQRLMQQRFGIDLSESSLGRILRQLGFSHISARPRHPKQAPEAISDFKKLWRPCGAGHRGSAGGHTAGSLVSR